MLDEQTLRKAPFAEGFQITLADGQQWWIPRPRGKFRPMFVDGAVKVTGGATFGADFEDDASVLRSVDVEPEEYLRAKMSLVVRLLLANYILTPSEVSDLVEMECGDPTSDARWEGISGALMGIDPNAGQ
jgi:hypothetical protein